MAIFCPVTGCKVYSQPGWLNRKVSDTFVANFWVIGDSIIYSLPRGRANLEGVKNSVALKEEIANHLSSGTGPYIQIQDYAALQGSSRAGRRYFINNANEDKRMISMIFCNLSPPLSIAVKIGNRFNTNRKIIHISKHYRDAIKRALEVGNSQKAAQDIDVVNILACFERGERSLSPVDLISNAGWNIETPKFTNRAVVVNQHILYSVVDGYLEEKDLPLIERMRSLCHEALPEGSRIEHIVVDSSKLIGASRSARINYMKALINWHKQYPFKTYIAYGGNTFMRTALRLARPLMPFRVIIAKDMRYAFDLINDDKSGIATEEHKLIDSGTPPAITDKDIEKLLAMIGSIDWELDGIDSDFDIGADHPFYFLYQSIKLIKEELDDLFNERKRLQDQLYQSRKMEAIGTLAGGVAHDFNNILSVILGNAEMALEDVPPAGAVHTNLEDIKTASLKAKDIVKQLLSFSSGKDRTLHPINISNVVKDALTFLRSSIPATIDIRQDIQATAQSVLADPTQINQLLMNLCINAFHVMEGTGGELKVSLEEISLDTTTADDYVGLRSGRHVMISVSDTGPGIPPQIIDRIFDPYFTTKKVGKGSGMGLSVVLGIIKTQNGAVKVENRPGKGATFKVLFPVHSDSSTRAPKLLAKRKADGPPVSDKIPPGVKRILFVDDDAGITATVQKMLERLGYRVDVSLNPEKALALFQAEPQAYDLVISDMTMPKMTGDRLAAKLMEIRPDVPVIICTGYSSLIDEKKANALGIADFVLKPFEINQFDRVIRRVLGMAKDNHGQKKRSDSK